MGRRSISTGRRDTLGRDIKVSAAQSASRSDAPPPTPPAAPRTDRPAVTGASSSFPADDVPGWKKLNPGYWFDRFLNRQEEQLRRSIDRRDAPRRMLQADLDATERMQGDQ